MICLYDIEVPTSVEALAATVAALPHRSFVFPPGIHYSVEPGAPAEPFVIIGGLGATEAEAVADWWVNFASYAAERGEVIAWGRRPEIEERRDYASETTRFIVMARLAMPRPSAAA